MHRHAARGNLLFQRLIGAQQQLLPGLSARVKRSLHLHAAKRASIEQAAVLARKGNALRHALVDNVDADFGQPIDIGFARAEIAALYRVIKKAEDAVAVIAIILGRIDAALRGNRVRPARRIVIGKAMDVIALLAQRGGR